MEVKERALKEHLQAPYTPVETEVFANRMSKIPSLLRFHPYDIRLAVTDNDSVTYVVNTIFVQLISVNSVYIYIYTCIYLYICV